MKLINFSLKDEPLAICIEVDGHVWDLHNTFAFEGLCHFTGERSVSLRWRSYRNRATPQPTVEFEIVFAEVDYLEVTPRDSEIADFGEDFCLAGLSRVSSLDDMKELIEFGVPQVPDFPADDFHLLFEFRSGQRVRVGAARAEFQRKLV